jgi:hypothetical protein
MHITCTLRTASAWQMACRLANVNAIKILEEQCEEWQVLSQRARLLEPLTLEGLLCTLVTELPPERGADVARLHVVSSRYNASGNFIFIAANMVYILMLLANRSL